MASLSLVSPRNHQLIFLMTLVVFGVATINAFSAHSPVVVSYSSRGISESSMAPLNHRGKNVYRKQKIRLSAANNQKKDQDQSIAGRSYDFIAVEEADKMLQQERYRNEQEIREMKILLENQQQELNEIDGLDSVLNLVDEEDPILIDLGFADQEDNDSRKDVDIYNDNATNNEGSPFFSSTSPTIDDEEEEYRNQHQRSHNTAECRTLEISLQQIDEENQDLKDELNNQENRYQSDIEETQRIICDVRDRSDCIQHELKMEMSYFERAKLELEEVLDQERSKARVLEQKLLVARREQEILEQAVIEARHRQQQEMQEQEKQEESECQQQQEQEELLYHEELLQNHQELVEIEKYQKELDDLYTNIYEDDAQDQNPNQGLSEQEVVAVNGRQTPHQYQNPDDSAQSVHSSHSPSPTKYERTQIRNNDYQKHQKAQYHKNQREAFSIAVTTENINRRQSKRESKRGSRTNSKAHGIFINFNDIIA